MLMQDTVSDCPKQQVNVKVIVAILVTGGFLSILNQTIMITALPHIILLSFLIQKLNKSKVIRTDTAMDSALDKKTLTTID